MVRKSAHRAEITRPLAILVFAVTLLHLKAPAPITAAPLPPSCAQVLVAVARMLGWPEAISPHLGLADRTYQVSGEGQAREPAVWAAISLLDDAHTPDLLDRLEGEGLTRGLYHGWEAIITHPGDPAGRRSGLVAWRCGPRVFLAGDDAGSGREMEIADALYASAVEHALCAPSGSLVILARTADGPGHHPLSWFRTLAAEADQYYGENGYGRVSFDFRFLDADGPQGDDDWFSLGSPFAAYGDAYGYGVIALRAALAAAGWPKATYLERAIVVYPEGDPSAGTRRLPPAMAFWSPRHQPIEVQDTEHKACLHVANLVVLSEAESLGSWAHELGHTLHARYEGEEGIERLDDRYSDPETGRHFGHVGDWDLMGSGGLWGTPAGSSPTQMSSFTKVAAGWLRYQPAVPNRDYVLAAVESQRMGDAVLVLEDPLGGGPLCSYYLLEARDHGAPYGAPESGVMIYHVTYDRQAGHPVVDALRCQHGDALGFSESELRPGHRIFTIYERSTLHGAREYVLVGGVVIRLMGESFAPYKATVRIERRPAE